MQHRSARPAALARRSRPVALGARRQRGRRSGEEAPLPVRGVVIFKRGVDVVVAIDAEELERLGGRALKAEHAAAPHHDQPVAQAEALRRVRDDDHRPGLARQLAQQRHHPRLEPRVQSGRGLIEEQQARAAQDLGRETDALALTARQRADARVGVRLEPKLLKRSHHGSLDLLLATVGRQPQARREAQRLAHAERGMHDLVLRQVADVGQARAHGLSVDAHLAARWRGDAGQRL